MTRIPTNTPAPRTVKDPLAPPPIRLRDVLVRLPAWALSIAAHLFLIWLFMGMVWITYRVVPKTFLVTLGDPDGGKKGRDEGALGKHDEEPPPAPEVAENATAPAPDPVPQKETMLAPGAQTASTGSAVGAPAAFSGRGGAGHGDSLNRFGGTEASERAVGEGLRWLVRHQDHGGRWRGRGWTSHCPADDHCDWPAREEFTPGVTGLALLCFLGAGNTYSQGEFADPVRRALHWLSTIQRPDGGLGCGSVADLYNHAVCTFAVTEAYAMTGNVELGRMAEKACAYLSAAQQASGGWDYAAQPSGRADMSIHGWAVAALRSARLAGIRVDPKTWEAAGRALTHLRTTDGRLTYSNKVIGADSPIEPGAPEYLWESLVPVGLLCREYLGVGDAAERDRAARRVIAGLHPPADRATNTNWMYFDSAAHAYYGSMALFHRGGADWEAWNDVVRERLIRAQCREDHARGSWDPEDGWLRSEGGRIYTTTLAILTLEVYYRYLPLYLAGPEAQEGTRVEFGKIPEDRFVAARAELSGADPRADGINDDAVTDLVADLDDLEDSTRRLDAARELVNRGERRAIPVLEKLIPKLADVSKTVYMELLARFQDPETVDFFADFLKSPSERVHNSALAILRAMSGKSGEKEIRAWLAARKSGK